MSRIGRRLDRILVQDSEVTGAIIAVRRISSFEKAVEALVINSIDSGADEISVKIDSKTLSATVSDNGSGISRAKMVMLGHATDVFLQEGNSLVLNHKGKSLDAIATTSCLEVKSRMRGEFETWSKRLQRGSLPAPSLAARQQKQCGTTAILTDFMALQPVRRRQLLETRCSSWYITNGPMQYNVRAENDFFLN